MIYEKFVDKMSLDYRKKKMKEKFFVIIICLFVLSGCGVTNQVPQNDKKVTTNEKKASKKAKQTLTPEEKEIGEIATKNMPQGKAFSYVDARGIGHVAHLDESAKMNNYDENKIIKKKNKVLYNDSAYKIRQGLDVSKHNSNIDWKKVKASGYDFVFIRIGYRGYGTEGKICLDEKFAENINGAKAAGLDTGVYFFSQAINEKEAKEEAEFVLKNLAGRKLELPVVFDPESILDAKARTDEVTGEQFTKNTIKFCETINANGYKSMVYANMIWESDYLSMSKLKNIPFWYADYEKKPQSPYEYEVWQYTSKGHIDGVKGRVDLNVMFEKK